MRKLINKILMVIMMIVFVISTIEITENVSKAANYNFNLTGSSRANKGDTITFTVTANGLTGNVKLTGSNVSLSNNQVWVEKNTVTFTATVTAFPASVTATPVELTDNDYNIVTLGAITRSISEIEITKPGPPATTPPATGGGGQSNNQGQIQGGNTGTQSNPTTQTNQGSSQTNQGSSQVNQGSATGSTTNQSSSQGNRNYQNNNSSNSGTNPVFTEQGQVKSSNNYLKNLQVSVGTLSPEFYRETYEYTIDNIIENEIEITAEAEDEKAIINGTGTIALSGGENVINVEVIAENEQSRTYTIKVNKIEETKQSDLRLESLEIETINEENKFEDLDIGFNKDTLDYRITVNDDITDLSVLATVDREGVIIKTEGEKNLKEGENIVTITLINQNNNESSQNVTYNNLNTDENSIENNGNINESNQSLSENSQENNNNQENNISNELQSTNVKEETVYTIKVTRKAKPIVEISNDVYNMKIKKIIAGIVLGILIIVLVVAIVINIKKKGNRKKEKLKRKVK